MGHKAKGPNSIYLIETVASCRNCCAAKLCPFVFGKEWAFFLG
jgi:hypothetical protein